MLLGVSAVTALWTAYELGAFDSAEETDALADAMSALNDELEDAVNNMTALERALFDTKVATETEVTELDVLFGILRDTNRAEGDRLKAYDELIRIAPEVQRSLTREQALTGDLAKEYDKLVASIEAKAFANALGKQFEQALTDELEAEKLLNAEVAESIKVAERVTECSG